MYGRTPYIENRKKEECGRFLVALRAKLESLQTAQLHATHGITESFLLKSTAQMKWVRWIAFGSMPALFAGLVIAPSRMIIAAPVVVLVLAALLVGKSKK